MSLPPPQRLGPSLVSPSLGNHGVSVTGMVDDFGWQRFVQWLEKSLEIWAGHSGRVQKLGLSIIFGLYAGLLGCNSDLVIFSMIAILLISTNYKNP